MEARRLGISHAPFSRRAVAAGMRVAANRGAGHRARKSNIKIRREPARSWDARLQQGWKAQRNGE